MNWRVKLLLWGAFCGGVTVALGFRLTDPETWVLMVVQGLLGTWATWPEQLTEREQREKDDAGRP